MAKKRATDDVSIGKFDILATCTYAEALLERLGDDEAKQRGTVAAIMGAQARLGIRKDHHEEFHALKEAAERKKKTTITAESFDQQVADKMGGFVDDVFLPAMKKLVETGLAYDEVKRLVKIPSTWGRRLPASSSASEPRSSSPSRTGKPCSVRRGSSVPSSGDVPPLPNAGVSDQSIAIPKPVLGGHRPATLSGRSALWGS